MKSIAKVLTGDIAINKTAERVFLVVFFSYLTFAASLIRIHIPFTPVPFTLQTMIVYFAAYYLSSREAGISQSLYIIAGLIGAPVFAAGITGAMALVGATAGYLAGFIIAGTLMAFVIGKIKELSYVKALLVFLAGGFLILAMGTMHLVAVYKMEFSAALAAGFLPFAGVELLKAITAASFFKLKK